MSAPTEPAPPGVVYGVLVPGLPQPLLSPEANPGYGRLREAFEQARQAPAPPVIEQLAARHAPKDPAQ